ncbi:hypothetical protein jhhlp_000259 [Lomentospora prolificans]|uniref:GH16 domain-containing protein n=1 Tax=Lomentospora prolificans TaxID=41688 RepID=A0A2N3NKI8_9PEZI|nr:hypothetical protein jhhlp_000259 [Lomentospora prolificans]
MRLTGFTSAFVIALAASSLSVVNADCECGYITNVGGSKEKTAFAELLESDFTRADAINSENNWMVASFNISKEETHGIYGLNFRPSNVVTFANKKVPLARAEIAKPAKLPNQGLELVVSSKLEQDMASVAELDSRRADLKYGSYRTSMKLTDMPGTCAAFFWYFNETQEIDMEFLSREFDAHTGLYPVNLIVQSPRAPNADYNPQKSGNFIRADLPFNPTTGYHEYRFDFLPGEVYFYADGKVLAKISGAAVPEHPGHLILQHWSNGNSVWSGGPPAKDTSISVRYVKAYFNSTDAARQHDSNIKCEQAKGKKNAVCEIPDVGTNRSAETFFFSKLGKNQTLAKTKTKTNLTNTSLEANHPISSNNKEMEEEASAMVWGVPAGLFAMWFTVVSAAVFAL